LRLIDVARLAETAADRDYGDRIYGAAFAPDGRLFTVANDGFLRAYDRSFRLVRKVATGGGKQPFSVAVDSGGERVAIGFYDSTKVEVYRTSDLGFAFKADTAGITKGNLIKVAWSSDSRRLLAGGRYKSKPATGGGELQSWHGTRAGAGRGRRTRLRWTRSWTSCVRDRLRGRGIRSPVRPARHGRRAPPDPLRRDRRPASQARQCVPGLARRAAGAVWPGLRW